MSNPCVIDSRSDSVKPLPQGNVAETIDVNSRLVIHHCVKGCSVIVDGIEDLVAG